jgi:O-antigen/teichoic acid export membrane protein
MLNNFLKKRSNFTKGVLLITGGTVVAQIVNVLVSPLITRLYTPEAFGILSVYGSILGLVKIVSSLKYELAIPIADDDSKAVNVLFLCFSVLLCFVLIIILFIFLDDGLLEKILKIQNLNNFKFYLPFGVFLIGIYDIFTQWAFRKQDYKSLSKTKYLQVISQNIVKIGLGLLNFGYSGLLLGTIVGESAGSTTLVRPFIKKNRPLLKNISVSQIKYCARRYIKFPLYSTISQIFNASGTYLPPLLIANLYGDQTVGYYGLAHTVISLPMTIVGKSVAEVFYSEAANQGKKNPIYLKQTMTKMLKNLFLLGLAPFVMLVFFGPFLFSLVFGTMWYAAGSFARIMALFIFFRLIFTPITNIFTIFEKQNEMFMLDLLRMLFVLGVFIITRLLALNAYIFTGLYSIAMTFIYLATFFRAKAVLNKEIKHSQSKLRGIKPKEI